MTAETNTIAPAIEHGLQQPADADSKSREDYELKEEEYIDSNNDGNLHFEQDAEPELHWRTWLAIVAMHLLVFTAVLGLQGPAAVVCRDPLNCQRTDVETLLTCRSITAVLHWSRPPQHSP